MPRVVAAHPTDAASRFERPRLDRACGATLPARRGLISVRADVLVGSAALHGAVLALVVHWLPVTPPEVVPRSRAAVVEMRPADTALVPPADTALVPPADTALVPPADAALVEVVLLDEPAPASRVPATDHAHATDHALTTNHEPAANHALTTHHAPGAVEATASHAPGADETTASHAPGADEATPHRAPGGLLRMRGADLTLAPDVAEHIAAGGPPLVEPVHESGKLDSVSGGGAVIRDRVTTVAVERDGTAHFADKPDIALRWHVPIPHLDIKDDLRELGDALQEWYRDPYAATRYGTRSELSPLANAVPGACDAWGDPMCDDPLAPDAEKRERQKSNSTVSLGGAADLTAWLYRRYAHADPYASRKAKLLDDTRAERIERGAAFRKEQAARSAELMQHTLEELWARVPDPAARRQALYELWSDCADDEAGARARAMVIGWIRARLPAGTGDAYTPDELARLAPFAPYAP